MNTVIATMDTCILDLGSPQTWPMPIILNIAATVISAIMWAFAAWSDHSHDASCVFFCKLRYGLAFGSLVRYLSEMAIALSAPVLFIFYLASPGSELACQVQALNNIGPVPWSLIMAVITLILLIFDLLRVCCTRYSLSSLMARAVVKSPGAFTGCHMSRSASVLILPAGGNRGIFVPPLTRELRAALQHQASLEESVGSVEICIRTILVDAWETAWQPNSSTLVLQNLASEGQELNVEATDSDVFNLEALTLDAIFIPYSKQLAAVNSGSNPTDCATRLLCLFGSCITALRPSGVFAAGVLSGSEARIWAASLAAVGFTDITVHPERVWLSPSPVVVLTARVPADGMVKSLPIGRLGQLALTPPPLRPSNWLPAGTQWRARDITVIVTWAIIAIFTWISSAYLTFLLIPRFVTWGSTVGSLCLSSALFGPSCVYYMTIEMTKFTAGQVTPPTQEDNHGKIIGKDGDGEINSVDSTVLLDDVEETGHAIHREMTAANVYLYWFTVQLPILAINIIVFPLVFWIPSFIIDTAFAGNNAAAASILEQCLSYGLLVALILAAGIWLRRMSRADEMEAMKVIQGSLIVN